MFQSQTGSQALSDELGHVPESVLSQKFQSQTGSQALSDLGGIGGFIGRVISFQSQTGSQALSDACSVDLLLCREDGFNPKREARPSQTRRKKGVSYGDSAVSIPNGKPGPLRPLLLTFLA